MVLAYEVSCWYGLFTTPTYSASLSLYALFTKPQEIAFFTNLGYLDSTVRFAVRFLLLRAAERWPFFYCENAQMCHTVITYYIT